MSPSEKFVFLDEMGVLLGIMRQRARSMKGERVYDIKPFYRGSRVTVVGAISKKKVIAMKTIGKSMNGEEFLKFVQEEREHPDFANMQKYEKIYPFVGKPTLSFPKKSVLESMSYFIASEE